MSQNGHPSLIDFRNVTVLRGGRAALDRLTLSIALGEHVAILGPNGCGKSTLIKTITRELHPLRRDSEPHLAILGATRWNIFDLRPQLGIVSQDWMELCRKPVSGREAILSGFFSSTEIWPHNHVTPAMEQRAAEILELLEIPHLASKPVSEMSSGEGRRVLIGRALVHDPRALILDEPTNSLDLGALHGLRETLRKIARSGVSVILVTHYLPDIIPEIDRVVLLKQGRIFRDGAKSEVLAQEPLSELFGVPIELVERGGYYHMI